MPGLAGFGRFGQGCGVFRVQNSLPKKFNSQAQYILAHLQKPLWRAPFVKHRNGHQMANLAAGAFRLKSF